MKPHGVYVREREGAGEGERVGESMRVIWRAWHCALVGLFYAYSRSLLQNESDMACVAFCFHNTVIYRQTERERERDGMRGIRYVL